MTKCQAACTLRCQAACRWAASAAGKCTGNATRARALPYASALPLHAAAQALSHLPSPALTGRAVFCSQGVAEGLAARVHDLRYGHAVQCIRWGGAGHAGPVSIACANGAAVEADAVVVTVSLGVLKAQHKALFEPALPLTKQDAIQRLSIGTVDKLLLDLAPGSASSSSGSGSGGGSGGGGSGDGGSVSGGRASGSAEAVSFALLWSEPWQGFGGSTSASASACVDSPPAAAPAPGEAQLPGWARGVFSIRFGGPEFKQRSAASAAAGVAQQAQQAAAGDAGRTGEAAEGHQEEFNPRAQAQQPRTYQV